MAIVREDEQVSSGCWHCHGHTFSRSDVKAELITLVKLSWPVMTNQVLWFVLTVISIVFSGHLGQTELAAAALGQSVIHVGFRSVAVGFSSACDTLFAQTYGSSNKKRVGVMLQRGILTSTLILMVCAGVLINTNVILLLLGQDPQVARLAGVYVYIYLIGGPMDVGSYILTKYLQCQSHMMPTVVVMVITTLMSVLFHYIAVYVLGYGLNGVMIAQVSSYYLQAVLLLVVIKWRNLHVETWGGWSINCLREWGMVIKLGLSGAVMLCLEWWSFEIGFFVAGTLGKAVIGAHSVLFYVATLLWSAGGGLGIGGSIHIGNSLGANKPHIARLSAIILMILGGLLGLSFAVIILSIQNVIGYIFTSDNETLQVLSKVIFLLAIFVVVDQMNGVNSGIVRGAGHQFWGGSVNLICLTCIGIPLFMVLVFVCDLGIIGMWTGLLVGFSLQAFCFVVFILKINWKTEAKKAMKRAAVLPKVRNMEENYDENEAEIMLSTPTTQNAFNTDTDTAHLRDNPIQSEHPTQTSDSDFEEIDTETDPLKAPEDVSILNPNTASIQKPLEHSDTGTQTEMNQLESEIEVDPLKVRGEKSDLKSNPLPIRKLVFLRATAFAGCMLWVCGAIAFNVLFPVSYDLMTSTHNVSETLHSNQSYNWSGM